ncbi:M4 family metallopeptidase [Ruminococcus sp.]
METQALNEAYSDIMAEYADDTREWKHGNDLYYKSTTGACIRNLASPQYPCLWKYEGKGSLENEDPKKQIDCHYASTIISHIAYVMHDMGIEHEVGMRIWYGSMDYLKNTEMDFQACRQ